jgi:sulfoxide reductase heme-binding subunit YedZ
VEAAARARGAPPEPQHAGARHAGHHRTPAPTAGFTPPKWLKPLIFALAALPLLWIAGAFASDFLASTRLLGSNPVEEMEHFTGKWALRFVAITLAVTPVRRITGWNWLQKYRRMLGLWAFAYACTHLTIYAALDLEFYWSEIGEDIAERPYITIGMTAFVLLLSMAITSTRGWIRRLGKRWTQLHRAVYVVAVLGTIHFWMAVKNDVREPLFFAVVFATLLGWRVWQARRRAGSTAPAA